MPAALPFREAIASLVKKQLLPTSLGSAELRQLNAALRRQSLFSARTAITGYLDEIKATVESVINPKQVVRDGQTLTVTEGFNPATARENLRRALQKFGYAPAEGEEGTIKDLGSDARLNLVVKTNTELAQAAGAFVRQNDPGVVAEWPALELVRYEDRKEPRDWEQRWKIAAQVAGDVDAARVLEFQGRMIALKSSGIWQALGDGAGGYDDTLGNPFPPFAFQSGMWTEDVSRADAVDLGLIEEGEKAEPSPLNLGELFAEVAA